MVGKQDKVPQLSIFDTPLERFINLEHELCILLEKTVKLTTQGRNKMTTLASLN